MEFHCYKCDNKEEYEDLITIKMTNGMDMLRVIVLCKDCSEKLQKWTDEK